jgi:hypothetical protein
MTDIPYWISINNSSEVIKLSGVNNVSLTNCVSYFSSLYQAQVLKEESLPVMLREVFLQQQNNHRSSLLQVVHCDSPIIQLFDIPIVTIIFSFFVGPPTGEFTDIPLSNVRKVGSPTPELCL